MKAVIMAGGEGTRLRPISLGLPKPMVKIIDKPVLGHILELLKRNGVTEACVTLRYMPETITEYIRGEDFGIKLETRIELEPLGTAGGVRNCTEFTAGEDFLVISGDCVCDFDLASLMRFHKEKGSDVTIGLYEHTEPLEYGLVITQSDGRIVKFVEKPPWEDVVTNKINTGVYIISPRALVEIPEGVSYDFGKNLFPTLLKNNRLLYGMSMDGYWCDIGNPGAYLQCCHDIITGRVSGMIDAPEISPGVYSKSPIPTGVVITPPVYIGQGVVLESGSVLGSGSVIGHRSSVSRGASISRSVICGASVLESATVSGAVVCDRSVIGRGASIREEAVIGEDCHVGDNSIINQSVSLWPGRRIPSCSNIRDNITHGMLNHGPYFVSRGVMSGNLGTEFSPAFALNLGSAAASFKRVGIGWQGGDAARIIADAFCCGVCGAGAGVLRFDCGLPSAVSFAGMCFTLPLSVCINQIGDRIEVFFFGGNGGLLPHDCERKLMSLLNSSTQTSKIVGQAENAVGLYEIYASAAARYAGVYTNGNYEVSINGIGIQNRVLKKTLDLLGFKITDRQTGIPRFEVSPSGMELCAYDEDGRRLSHERLLLLTASIEFRRGRRELAASYEAPAALDALARRYDATVYRLGRDGERADGLYEKLRPMRDGVFAAALICGYLRQEKTTLSALISEMPRFSLVTRELPVQKSRSEIMSALSAAVSMEAAADLSTGVVFKNKNGSVRVMPARDRSALLIKSEGATEEIAQELCSDLIEQLHKLDSGRIRN